MAWRVAKQYARAGWLKKEMTHMEISDIRERLRQACDAAGSIHAWAKANGINKGPVSMVLRGLREPSPAIQRALGIRRAWIAVDMPADSGYKNETNAGESAS